MSRRRQCVIKMSISNARRLIGSAICEIRAIAAASIRPTQAKDGRSAICPDRLRRVDKETAMSDGADHIRRQTGLSDWIEAARMQKWKFAKKTMLREDRRWSAETSLWTPTADYPTAKRPLGHPRTRWEDDWKKISRNWRHWTAEDWDHIKCAYVRCE
uniref:Uncharacterized protein n=1 Tax=Steinernema glaseri TaxID=37863 RepID=A0A1I8AGJ0_9BILA